VLVAATGPLCPSARPSGIHPCVSASLFSMFALCVRLTCLFKTLQFAQKGIQCPLHTPETWRSQGPCTSHTAEHCCAESTNVSVWWSR